MKYNRTKEKEDMWSYRNFCGDLQNDLLGILPVNRIGKEAKELKSVLGRACKRGSIYRYNADYRGGGVNSPIAGKKLKFDAWKGILLNSKLPLERFFEVPQKDGRYIDNSMGRLQQNFKSRFQTLQ